MSSITLELAAYIAKNSLKEAIDLCVECAPDIPLLTLQNQYAGNDEFFINKKKTLENYEIAKTQMLEALYFNVRRLKPDLQDRIRQGLAANTAETRKFLFLASTPKEFPQLYTVEEHKAIYDALQHSRYKDFFELAAPVLACSLLELKTSLNNQRPAIVHFSGHGTHSGLYLLDKAGISALVPTDILEKIFAGTGEFLRLVFLNACYSEVQAKIISKNKIWVIGMNAPIGDQAAREFAQNYYSLLGSDLDYVNAFKGTVALSELTSSRNIPVLWYDGQQIV
jgi:hypothetical protein